MANGKSDGSVIIDTKMDTSGIDKGVSDTKSKMNSLIGSLKNLCTNIKETFSAKDTSGSDKNYADLRKEIEKTEKQLDKLIEKQIRYVEIGGNKKSQTFAGMEYDIETTRTKLETLRSQLNALGEESPKKVSRLKKWIDKLVGSFSSLNKTTKNTHRGILKMLGTSLLFSTVFRAINTITKGFAEGLNNLVHYSEEANGTMSALKSSLTQLKNGFAVAFMPLISSVMPLLTKFIGAIIDVTNKLSAFFAALSGRTTYTKAIKVQEDYAKSLKNTSKAAKDATKYLSGLDEIRTFTEPGTQETSPLDMFTEEKVDIPTTELAEKVKNALEVVKESLKNGDWKGIGNQIGEVLAGIDWVVLLKKALVLGVDIGQLIAEIWFGAFQTAPIETAIITAFGLLKLTGIGGVLTRKILEAISESKMVDEIGKFFSNNLGKIFGVGSIFAGITIAVKAFIDMWKNGFSWIKEALMIIGLAFAAVGAIILGAPAVITAVIAGIIAAVATLAIVIKDNWGAILEFFENLKLKIIDIWSQIVTGIKNSINKVITVINKMINGVVDGINSLIKVLNSLSFSFPDWIPGLGGKSFGLNLNYVKAPQIPYLASGAVIPPNAPFMAVLGDQKNGTNIEAPLDTIKQAVREVIGGGNNGNYRFTAQINRRTLFDEFIDEAKLRQSMTGRNPFDFA